MPFGQKMNPKIDEFILNAKYWREEMAALRAIALDTPLTEELKWGQPCYTFEGANVVIIGAFKEYCALNFIKGVLCKDPENMFVKAGEHSQSARQIRFTDVRGIHKMKSILKAYLLDAIDVERSGMKVPFTQSKHLNYPEELQQKMGEIPEFKTAFEALTPGRQRAYILHFSQAKQSTTRTARIEKYLPQILDGKGINDCTCGLSKKMPYCDGSHKQLHNDS